MRQIKSPLAQLVAETKTKRAAADRAARLSTYAVMVAAMKEREKKGEAK